MTCRCSVLRTCAVSLIVLGLTAFGAAQTDRDGFDFFDDLRFFSQQRMDGEPGVDMHNGLAVSGRHFHSRKFLQQQRFHLGCQHAVVE